MSKIKGSLIFLPESLTFSVSFVHRSISLSLYKNVIFTYLLHISIVYFICSFVKDEFLVVLDKLMDLLLSLSIGYSR
jgi:hypothetical protein